MRREQREKRCDVQCQCLMGPRNRPESIANSKTSLRHNGERKIVSLVSEVASLEVVAIDCNNAAIGQVAKGAVDWVS